MPWLDLDKHLRLYLSGDPSIALPYGVCKTSVFASVVSVVTGQLVNRPNCAEKVVNG